MKSLKQPDEREYEKDNGQELPPFIGKGSRETVIGSDVNFAGSFKVHFEITSVERRFDDEMNGRFKIA